MNSLFTNNPVVGTPLTPSIIRAINTAVRKHRPIAGHGVRISYTLGGAVIHANPAPSVGGGVAQPLLFPFKCVPWVKYPAEEESGGNQSIGGGDNHQMQGTGDNSSMGGSGSEEKEPEYDGYRFYVPDNYSLFYNGMAIQFARDVEEYREGQGYDPEAWKVWRDIDKNTAGIVWCEVYDENQGSGIGDVQLRARMAVDGGTPECGCCGESCCATTSSSGQSNCSCAKADVVFRFPVCRVDNLSPSWQEGEQREGKFVEQYQFGELVYRDDDNGLYKIVGDSFGNPYYWNGGVLMEGPNVTKLWDECKGKLAAIEVLDGQEGDCVGTKIVYFDNMEAFNEANKNPDADYIPLYLFNQEGGVLMDFRRMPRGGSWAMLV